MAISGDIHYFQAPSHPTRPMPLVNYSDSESDGTPADTPAQDATKNTLKRKRNEDAAPSELPPLPSAFHDLYTTEKRIATHDDPSLHGGRKRAIPHKEGNWITHAYLECNPLSFADVHTLYPANHAPRASYSHRIHYPQHSHLPRPKHRACTAGVQC
jgi:hypothetical protein